MVKKMKSAQATPDAAGSRSAQGSHLAASVKDSAQQIWLAGMGAFSKAQEEGSKVFEALVKEGQSLQKKTQGMAEEKIGEVTGKMSAMAETVTAKAGQNWDKLESIFEQRTAKAMSKLGVPTAKDVQALTDRVDALAAAVARLGKAAKSSTTAAAAPGEKVMKAAKAVKPAKVTPAAPAPTAEATPVAKPVRRARKRAA
jgi:poly(hydroxyalkanoate) granule-associated protein